MTLLLLGSLCASSWRRLEGRTAMPTRLPTSLRDRVSAASSHIHIFVRPRCAHCQRHLENLDSAMQELPASIQDSLRARIHLWSLEETIDSGPGLQLLPVAPRLIGVHWTPTTWFVSAADSICGTWLGERSPMAWQGGLQRLRSSPGAEP